MKKEDPADVTKSLANDFNNFIDKLSFDVPVTKVNVHGTKEVGTSCGDDQSKASTKAHSSFASILQKPQAKATVKITKMRNSEVVEGARVAIPMAAVEEVSSRFQNTLYGFFIRKRMAFPLVENYFETKDGMEKVIEGGPWLIRLIPLFLNVWTPNTILKKDEIKSAPIWVKLHHVPIVAYSEVGLSLITTQIGCPIMLDTYTSSMCLRSWVRNEYDRALVELSAKEDLLDSLVIAIPHNDGKGHSLATIDIEYEWTPPDVLRARLAKPKPTLYYRRVEKGETSQPVEKTSNPKVPKPKQTYNEGLAITKLMKKASTILNESDSDGEELIMEESNGKRIAETETKGASTPVTELSVCAILESHARESNLVKLCSSVFKHWDWTSNGNLCVKGTHIILGWNNYDVDVTVISQSDQVIHARIWLKSEKKEFYCSFIYGHNRYTHRRALWENLCVHKNYVRNRPWCLLGDFNAALFLADSTTGSSSMDIAMREFKECVAEIEVMDVPSSGLQFTWNQKPKGLDGLLKKIDRVLGNVQFSDSFMGSHAVFQPYRISDHAPAVLKIPTVVKSTPKPFKFSNILTQHVRFKEVVNEGWLLEVLGFYMFRLIKKLKYLKKPFRKLLYDHGNIHDNVNRLRTELNRVQADLDVDPFNVVLREEEVAYVQAYNDAILMQERFLKQKAKILWLKEGDLNSAYFHKAVKGKVANAFVAHYEVFLGQEGHTSTLNSQGLFKHILDNATADDMIRNVSDNEIKEAMFSMGNDKSLGPDGYTAVFFKEAWDIVGNDVIKAIKEFFTNGKLLKELNHMIIPLIPKVQTPSRVNDYRPISCCNVLFKCISKVIANRIKGFLKEALRGFGFHERMILWIMECVTTTSLSISINGSLHGHFKGRRGLQQDDLFLFAHGDFQSAKIIMECLDEFKLVSGLTPNLPKSIAYFCNVLNHVKLAILQVMPFEEGRLSVKYLGVPLVPSRLVYKDCKELIELKFSIFRGDLP
ncbi:hypothetical protein Tco_0389736 [Tanacetum coccineum]